MGDAVCSVSNSNEDINILMIKRTKSSKNNRWKKEVHGVVVSCLVDSSSVSADSTFFFSSVRLSSVAVKNKRRNDRAFDRCERKKFKLFTQKGKE